jgi:hypothetical protein
MTDLSPAAQAVLRAAGDSEPGIYATIAAALRKLEDILAQDRAEPLPPDLERAVLTERIRLFRRITAIAAELEACCEWIPELTPWDAEQLRAARRPKPPSLKKQALESLQFVDEKLDLPLHNHCNAIHTIRRALEALDD